MKLAFAFLLMSTTLGAGSAVLAAGQASPLTPDLGIAGLLARSASGSALTLIDDGEGGEGGRFWLLAGNEDGDDDEDEDDHDDEDDCEEDEEGDDDDCAAGSTANAATAGTVAPPKNGLFTNGTAPVVKSN